MSRKHHTVLHRPMHQAAFANGHQVRGKSGTDFRVEQERWLAKQKRKPKVKRPRSRKPRSIPEILDACRVEKTIVDILWECSLWSPGVIYGYGPDIHLGDFLHMDGKTVQVTGVRHHINIDYSTIERRIVAMYQKIFRQARGRARP